MAIALRALKRFVNEKCGPETGDYQLHREGRNERMLPPSHGDYERVAVIGAGVSGLTVAPDLTCIGYKMTVFEAPAEPGGMLTVGVPVFRLPRELVRHEINAMLSLGVELKCNNYCNYSARISTASGSERGSHTYSLRERRSLPLAVLIRHLAR